MAEATNLVDINFVEYGPVMGYMGFNLFRLYKTDSPGLKSFKRDYPTITDGEILTLQSVTFLTVNITDNKMGVFGLTNNGKYIWSLDKE